MKPLWSVAIAALLWGDLVAAEILPQSGIIDGRIQSVDYSPDDVVLIRAAAGYQVTIKFSTDERIENIAVGDSAAWQVATSRRGDYLFLKMLQNSPTNLVVVTDAHVYNFTLVPAYSAAPDLPYIVKFRYPTAAKAAEAQEIRIRGRYKLSGARSLRPTSISDDGVHTFISWPEDSPLPAVYAIGFDGQEFLVNSSLREGKVVVDGVSSRLLFRLNRSVARAARVPIVERAE